MASMLTIYSIPFSMVTTFFVSYIYEIFGRKITLFLSFFFTSMLFYIIPYTAPNYNLLVAVRCMIGITMSAPLSHPLIADYIVKKARGKAIALNGMGVTMGEVIAMGVLFNFTKNMDEKKAFAIVSCVIFAFSFYFLIYIEDPDLKDLAKRID